MASGDHGSRKHRLSRGRNPRIHISLIKLRDLPQGVWNVDTLFLLPERGREDQLENLARTWKADEIEWIGGEEADSALGRYSLEDRNNPRQVLRVWWD